MDRLIYQTKGGMNKKNSRLFMRPCGALWYRKNDPGCYVLAESIFGSY